ADYRKDLNDEYRIVESAILYRLRNALVGKKVATGPAGIEKGANLKKDQAESLVLEQVLKLRMVEDELNKLIEDAEQQLLELKADLDKRFAHKKGKLQSGDDLAPGVLKIVKVYLAI